MQAGNIRRPSGTGIPQYNARGSQLPRPSIITNGESNTSSSPFHSPQSPQATTPDAISFYRTRPFPSMNNATPRDFPSIDSNGQPGANYQRSISGPPLRKTTSSSSLGFTARSQNGAFRDLVAKFDQSQEDENASMRIKYSRSPSSFGLESRDRTNESYLSSVPLSTSQNDRIQLPRRDASKQADNEPLQSRSDRNNHEPSPPNANFFSEPRLDIFQPEMPLSHKPSPVDIEEVVSQDFLSRSDTWAMLGGRYPSSQGGDQEVAGAVSRRVQRRVSDALTLQPTANTPQRLDPGGPRSSPPMTPPHSGGTGPRSSRSPRALHQRSVSDIEALSAAEYARRSPGFTKTSPSGVYGNTFDRYSPTTSRSRLPIRNDPHFAFNDVPRATKRSKTDYTGETDRIRVYRRSITPPGRFYSATFEQKPVTRVGSGEKVKAIITAPAVKSTPPLRSSRPRQHVSTARSSSPTLASPIEDGAISPQSLENGSNANNVEAASTLDAGNLLTRLSNAVYPKQAPKLTLDLKNISQSIDQGPKTGVTVFEEDDPLPQPPGSFPDTQELDQLHSDNDANSGNKRITAESDRSRTVNEHETRADEQSEQVDDTGTQVLDKIMELRQRSSVLLSGVLGSLPTSATSTSSSRTAGGNMRPSMSPRRVTASGANGSASPTSGSDSPVMTKSPLIQSMSFGYSSTLSEYGAALPPRGKDDDGPDPNMFGDASSSEGPSSAWRTQERLLRSKTDSTLGSPIKGFPSKRAHGVSRTSSTAGSPAKSGFQRTPSRTTLDSDSYSVINRVLDQYSETGYVSPEMVHSFQQHILETDPELAARSDIDSMSIARAALEDLVRDHTQSHLFSTHSQPNLTHSQSQSDVFSSSSSHLSQPPTPKKYDLSPPTVRKMTSAALQNLGGNRSDLYAPDRLPDRLDLSPSHSYGSEYRSHHYTNADKLNSVPQIQEPPASARESLEDIGPTPPPKDQKYPLTGAVERQPTVEPRHLIERVPPRHSSNAISNKRPVLPEIVSTGGGLGLFGTPRPSVETTAWRRPNSGNYASNKSQVPPATSHLAPTPPNFSRSATATSAASATESVQTVSGQQVPESLVNGQGTPATSFTQPASIRSTDSPVPTASVERVSTSTEASPEQRRLTKRRHLIKELVDTEFSFNQDMKVIEDIYNGTASAVDALTPDDRRILFGNSAQIVEFSEAFLDTLKQAAASVYVMPRTNKWRIKRGSISKPPSTHEDQVSVASTEQNDDERDRKTYIGEAFGQHMARMEKVYGDYLRNHELANQRLAKLQNVPQVSLWLNECHTYASDITSAWDLDSLLVKPVQRILKYPLLLKSLLEETPNDHADFSALEIAVKQMMDVSYRINESKKRAELLEQVVNKPAKRKEIDVSTALSKAFGRRNDKLKQQVSLSDAVEDPEYKAISEKFGGQFFQLQVVMRDMEMYKKSTEKFVQQFNSYIEAIEEMIDVGHHNNPEMEAKWRRLSLTIREMTAIAYMDHVS